MNSLNTVMNIKLLICLKQNDNAYFPIRNFKIKRFYGDVMVMNIPIQFSETKKPWHIFMLIYIGLHRYLPFVKKDI
jgi:hypothetical protein